MTRNDRKAPGSWRLWAVAGLALAFTGCGLHDVNIPDIQGPSELAIALHLTVTPDVVTADGLSTAFIQAEVRDGDGRAISNREIFFAIADESGHFADIGTLFDLAGNQLGATDAIVTTNGQGLAQLIYRTPPRTDATANQTVLVAARPVGTDANGAVYRTVRLELRSAEPRLFPQNPDNAPPTCHFIIEAPGPGGSCTSATSCVVRANTSVLFQTTSFDSDGTIIRYEWYFGDGTLVDYHPDTNHVFRFPGTFTITHIVTDDDGGAAACAASLTVLP
jgi:hypothetical protein